MRKKNQLQFIVIVLFILGIASFGYLIVKETLHTGVKTAEILNIKTILADRQALLKRMQHARERTPDMEAHLEELQLMIPGNPQQEQILTGLQRSAEEASLVFGSVQFGEHIREDGYAAIPMKLTFQGEYKSFLKLLNRLMHGERLYRIDEINLGSVDGSLSIEITASVFYKEKVKE